MPIAWALIIKQAFKLCPACYGSGFVRSLAAGIKVSSIPCCKRRGVNSLQDDRCLQSTGYSGFLCRFSPSGIAAVPPATVI